MLATSAADVRSGVVGGGSIDIDVARGGKLLAGAEELLLEAAAAVGGNITGVGVVKESGRGPVGDVGFKAIRSKRDELLLGSPLSLSSDISSNEDSECV